MQNRMLRVFLAFAGVACLEACFCLTAWGQATITPSSGNSAEAAQSQVVPHIVRFSSVLKDAQGQPRTGTFSVAFAIYVVSEGGVPLWSETQNVGADLNGHYDVLLGSTTPGGLPDSVFGAGANGSSGFPEPEGRWVGVRVAQEAEVSPRFLLVSVPYALKAGDAETLGGKPASAYVTAEVAASPGTPGAGLPASANPAVNTTNLSNNAAATGNSALSTIKGLGTTNYIPIYTGSTTIGNSLVFQNGANVGIGTSTPAQVLDVTGNIHSSATVFATTFSGAFSGNGSAITNLNASNLAAGTVSQSLLPATVAVLNAANTFTANQSITGNLSVTGSVTGNSFSGSGSGLTNVTAGGLSCAGCVGNSQLGINYAGSSSQGGSATSALTAVTAGTATNANELGGLAPSAYGVLANSNTFTADQTINGKLTLANDFNLPNTTSSTVGVINFGGNPFLHNFGTNNTFLGHGAGNFTMTGDYNSAIGYGALSYNTTGLSNTATGGLALGQNTTGLNNTAIGFAALYENTTGNYNTATGLQALTSNTTGTNNTALGFNAGLTTNTANANTTGSNNTFIGYNSGPGTSTQLSNATAIGANALVSASNAMVLGNGVNVGIGTSTPAHALDVVGDGNFSGTVTANSFTGNGSGLTGVTSTATSLSCTGCVGNSQLGINYAGSSSQGGAATSALTAATATNASNLGGLAPSAYAVLASSNTFTADQTINGNLTLSGSINSGLVVQSNSTSPNVIGGFSGNSVSSGVHGATIGGGGANGSLNRVTSSYGTVGGGIGNTTGTVDTVGGGQFNTANGPEATVGGGASNTATGLQATVGGGANNTATGADATVGGGNGNTAGAGYQTTVGGGYGNTASGFAATVPGGYTNTASGDYSFAGGRGALATDSGSFVWCQTNGSNCGSQGTNSFVVSILGSFQVYTNTSGTGCGIDTSGNLTCTGTINGSAKNFKVDDPADPANKYLVHSSVESSETINIYTGNVVLDASGAATVELPSWFQAENADFRYSLTPIGAPGPNLYVAEEVTSNQFKIAGGKPGLKVSWQITAARQDAWAKAHPVEAEQDKPANERGLYLHPELYGQPKEKGIGWTDPAAPTKRH